MRSSPTGSEANLGREEYLWEVRCGDAEAFPKRISQRLYA